jgi:signal transduction histidine kinase
MTPMTASRLLERYKQWMIWVLLGALVLLLISVPVLIHLGMGRQAALPLAVKLDALILGVFLAVALWVYFLLKRVGALARREMEAAHLKLADTTADLKEAAEIKAKFLSVVSHELRTPLTVIIGFAQILSQNIAQYEKPVIKRYLDLMDTDAHRLLRLIEGLLDLSEAERQDLHLTPVEFDLRAMSAILIEGFRISRKEHRIEFTIEEGLSTVYYDKDRIQQILVNSIDNALKYSPAGTSVHLSLMRQNGGLAIHVTDSGPGIPDDLKEKVFEPFFRSPDANDRKAPGSGLGLAVIKAIVDALGGNIFIEDVRPHGSRFVCLLPQPNTSPSKDVPVDFHAA